MTLVRRVVELGRAARAASSVKTRQPLSRALVSAPGWAQLPVELVAEVSDELNVRAVEVLGEEAGLVDVVVKPNFRELGKRFGKRTPVVAQAITDVEPATLANGVRGDGSFSIMVDSESEDVYADDIIVTESPREGWTVASGRRRVGRHRSTYRRRTPPCRPSARFDPGNSRNAQVAGI